MQTRKQDTSHQQFLDLPTSERLLFLTACDLAHVMPEPALQIEVTIEAKP